MAMNPMQRKANNYLLIGVLVTLLITGSVIAFLIIQLNKVNEEYDAQKKALKTTYVLASDLKSGDKITADSFKQAQVSVSSIPSNAVTIAELSEDAIAKINLSTGQIVTKDMIAESTDKTTDDLRVQEYNMIVLPSQLKTDEYIDIRLRLPSGEDYIVISKKQVQIPEIAGIPSENSIWIKMSEADTQIMSSAIVEAYIMQGAVLYANTFVEPGMQQQATPSYVPSDKTIIAMQADSNITQEAKNSLFNRFNNARNAVRDNGINPALGIYNEDRNDNIEQGVQAQINKSQEDRQSYLESLTD